MAKYAIKNFTYRSPNSKILVKYDYIDECIAHDLKVVRKTDDIEICHNGSLCERYDWWAFKGDHFWKDKLSVLPEELYDFEDDDAAILAFEVM